MWNDMNIWSELFSVIEPAYDVVRTGFVNSNIKMISVDMQLSTKKHSAKFGGDHNNWERFLISDYVFKLDIFKHTQQV